MNQELKPCPCCDSPGPFQIVKSTRDIQSWYEIDCKCGLSVKRLPAPGQFQATYEEAAAVWNRRPPPAGSYDEAVRALAPYLPDGWVCHDSVVRGSLGLWWHPSKPGTYTDGYWAVHEYPQTGNKLHLSIPAPTDWRSSLRRILSGAVTEGETKLVDSEKEER